jgi:transposase
MSGKEQEKMAAEEVMGGAAEPLVGSPEAVPKGAVGVPAGKAGETPRQQIRKAKQATRRRFSAEEKIRVVMEGIRGEEPVSVLCRREGLQSTVYYRWLKDFMEAGKQRLRGDTLREARRDEVEALKAENQRLKQLVAEYALDLMALKKSVLAER